MELVTLGGASVRLTPPGTEQLETAGRLEVGVTGAECNAAVAASRLGVDATWLSRLGDGPLGRRVAAAVRGEEVDVVAEFVGDRQGVTFHERGPDPRGDDRIDDVGGAAIEGLRMDDLPTASVETADVAYVTASTPLASTGVAGASAKFLKTASDAGATTALGLLDAGGWQDLEAARETLEGLFPVVDVLVATAPAVEAVFDRSGEPGTVTHALASSHGFETVALRRRHDAATWHDSTVHEFDLLAVDATDVSGAADAFAGTFLARLPEGDVQRGLRTAVAAEALAKTVPGATASFTAAEVDAVAERVGSD